MSALRIETRTDGEIRAASIAAREKKTARSVRIALSLAFLSPAFAYRLQAEAFGDLDRKTVRLGHDAKE